jgi:putative zinc finger protein
MTTLSEPASVSCAGAERTRFRRAITAHFAGRIDPTEERALRLHLHDCRACRRGYARAHALASIDPRAPRSRERLARGLGFAAERRAWFTGLARHWAWGVPALAAIAWMTVRPAAPAPARPELVAPSPRGTTLAAPALLAYRIPPNGAPRIIDGAIEGGDELAFAYANPAAWPYLMVFAVDEHRHVYWYHPAWRPGAPPPTAVPAQAGAGPFELPSATRHALDGGRLVVHAVFARRAVSVQEIEHAAETAGTPEQLKVADDLQVVRRPIEVRR